MGNEQIQNQTAQDAFSRLHGARIGSNVNASLDYLVALRNGLYEWIGQLDEELAKRAQVERDGEDDEPSSRCSNPGGHEWKVNEETDRSYCCHCGADGDA